MRPILKLSTGNLIPNSADTVQATYIPYSKAYPVLEANIGHYCSYCEVFSSDLQIEHVISKKENSTLEYDWSNFLLACARCNGKANKSDEKVDLTKVYLPHLHNTFLVFLYEEGGFIRINTPFLSPYQQQKAQNTLDLLGIDKHPNNTKYNTHNPRDKRWEGRRRAWEYAVEYLSDMERGEKKAVDIISFAQQCGFFSVWFTVFSGHPDFKRQLIEAYRGTAVACFDATNNYIAVPRSAMDI